MKGIPYSIVNLGTVATCFLLKYTQHLHDFRSGTRVCSHQLPLNRQNELHTYTYIRKRSTASKFIYIKICLYILCLCMCVWVYMCVYINISIVACYLYATVWECLYACVCSSVASWLWFVPNVHRPLVYTSAMVTVVHVNAIVIVVSKSTWKSTPITFMSVCFRYFL